MGFHATLTGSDLHYPAREFVVNDTGSTIPAYHCVKADEFGSLDLMSVALSTDASDEIYGITETSITTGSTGFITIQGYLTGLDTSSYLVGTDLYSSGTGALSSLPFGSSIGRVVKSNATSGVVKVTLLKGSGGAADTDRSVAESDTTIVSGNVIRMKSNGHIDLALANSNTTWGAFGVAITSGNIGDPVEYRIDTEVTLSDWSSITGTLNLTPGATYYLSDITAGRLTSSPTGTAGSAVVQIGRAKTSTILVLEIQNPIAL